MGKAKKVGIGVGIAIGVFFAVGITVAAVNQQEEDQLKEVAKAASLSPEEIKAKAIQPTYDDLMRNNENYVGNIVHYKGKIHQVQNVHGDTYVLRVGTSEAPWYFDDVIWINYAGQRVLEDDIVAFWGEVKGLKEYIAVLGNPITIPEVDASILDVIQKQGEESP